MPDHDATASTEAATRASLVGSLDAQREHVLGIIEGLSASALRAPQLPSGWSCLGLVRHLTFDVERYWFTCIVGGADLGDEGWHWDVPEGLSADEVFDQYRAEIRRANAVIERVSLDAPPAQRDPWWGEWEVPDHRFVLLHVITETACHAGHLDAARELIDRRQWITLS